MTTVVYGRNSWYSKTPQTNNYVNYLDYWSGSYILPNVNDTQIVIDPLFNHRPDLLAYQLYGATQLLWVFMLRNPDKIKDPIYDFVSGLQIYVPSKDVLLGTG
jgi:Base plate wedge protein 53